MKYCILIIDGAAGLPLPERGGKTCLEIAVTPNLDTMVKEGTLGLVRTVPPGMEPSSACACMSVLGYDPTVYYRGRAAIEARSMGVAIGKDEVVFRCNLVAVRGGIMYDYSAGHISTREARDLALLLRAGALRAPMVIVEERTVGPSLGQENIDRGFLSVIVGFVLVLLFMAVYYKVFGLVANLALTLNLVLMVAILSIFQATLTLPGIAGIVLTVGMAVDANVLIFERIREEMDKGKTVWSSIETGYGRALITILDANVTTLIAGIVLYKELCYRCLYH